MKKNEIEKVGFYIILINIIISLFLLTSEGDVIIYWITTIASNLIAILFNSYAIKISNNKKKNIISLIFNIIIIISVIIYGVVNII